MALFFIFLTVSRRPHFRSGAFACFALWNAALEGWLLQTTPNPYPATRPGAPQRTGGAPTGLDDAGCCRCPVERMLGD